MSWNEHQFRKNWNWHHVPPRHPAPSTPIKIRVTKADHNAYNLLFQNAASLEQCIEILKRYWWPTSQ
jgi:hypothetical protein